MPQGSILGPLLFLIFINDISQASNYFKYILYADDSTLSSCLREDELEESTVKINNELSKIHKWLTANKILINKQKTKFMILSYNRNVMIPTITIGGNIIEETDTFKLLGIYIDNHLTFKDHIHKIAIKISKSVGILYRLNKFLPPNVLKLIYSTLVHPYLIYGLEAWFGTFKNNTNKIFILQKKAIRAINGLNYNEHTNDYFKLMNILKIEDQYKLQITTFIHKLLNLDTDCNLATKLIKNSQVHHHGTRQENKLNIRPINKARSKFSLIHNGGKIWNTLPEKLRKFDSLSKFKIHTKSHFLDNY